MTDRLTSSKLRSHGDAERKLELTLGPAGPWHTTVTVTAVRTNHGRNSTRPHDWLFEVTAAWHGPPAIGFPHSNEPVDAHDTYVLTTPDAAKRLAHIARDEFAKGGNEFGEPPDLRALAKQL